MSEINMLSPETTTVGILTVVGGFLLKFTEKFLDNKNNLIDEHSSLRKELREELDKVKEELIRIQEEVDEWRERYYHQVETTNELLFEVNVLKSRLSKYENITGEHRYKHDD